MRAMMGKRQGVRLRIGAVVVVLMSAGLWAPVGVSQAAVAGPGGLNAVKTATNAVSLSWSPTKNATAYRVRMSSTSAMKDPKTWDVVGTRYEWTHLDPNPGHISDRLQADTTYYFQVKAITTDKKDITGYSPAIGVRTATSAKTAYLPVIDFTATAASSTAMYVSWSSRGPGVRYRVRYSTDPNAAVLSGKAKDFTTAGGVLTGLKAKTTYYLNVRVIDTAKAPISEYSERFSLTTPASVASPGLTVASYNILKSISKPAWESRRTAVVASIKAQSPHIVALQEAVGSTVTGVKGKKVAQYADILQMLGTKYAYVTTKSSAGTRLAYHVDRLKLVKADVVKLTTKGDAQRYAVWAIFQDKQSKKKLFMVDTHLEPGGQTSASYNDARIKQAKEVLALIKAKGEGLPVVVAGDMNSSRANQPTNGAYLTFSEGGLVDPLGDANLTWPSSTPVAEHALDREYNAYNNLERRARRTAWLVGTRVDYILVSKNVRVAQARTVVDVDTAGNFVGTIPSDHNLLTTIVHLP